MSSRTNHVSSATLANFYALSNCSFTVVYSALISPSAWVEQVAVSVATAGKWHHVLASSSDLQVTKIETDVSLDPDGLNRI